MYELGELKFNTIGVKKGKICTLAQDDNKYYVLSFYV
jgi:hypothetical protein